MGRIICGDTLEETKKLPDESVDCIVTSPPYWGLRNYGVEGQLGLEKTPEEYVDKLTEIFRELRRVLKKEGTCWLNLGDSYCYSGKMSPPGTEKQRSNRGATAGEGIDKSLSGYRSKNLVGIPWRVAFSLQKDGWYLRQDIIWAKPNPMPESVKDRCTKSHEYIFLLTKSPKYYFDSESIEEPKAESSFSRYKYVQFGPKNKARNSLSQYAMSGGNDFSEKQKEKKTRNKRDVWFVATRSYKGAHFATFPPKLIEPCILAGCPKGGVVLDPFAGSGTTLWLARELGRDYMGIELKPDYIKLIEERLSQGVLKLEEEKK